MRPSSHGRYAVERHRAATAGTSVWWLPARCVRPPSGRTDASRPEPASGDGMNAIDLLEQDHRAVEGVMDQIEASTERAIKGREELFRKFRLLLTVHEVIEETIFY